MISRASSGGGGGGGAGSGAIQVARGTYDFEAQGGLNGQSYGTGAIVPAGAVVVRVVLLQRVAMDKGPGDPARLTLTLQTAGDLVSINTLYNVPPWNQACAELLSFSVLMTAQREVTLTIDEMNDVGLSAGTYDIFVFYFDPNV